MILTKQNKNLKKNNKIKMKIEVYCVHNSLTSWYEINSSILFYK